jgi:hypothetical protein
LALENSQKIVLIDGGRMDTVYLRVNSENPDETTLKKAAELIGKGELVVFPTETRRFLRQKAGPRTTRL